MNMQKLILLGHATRDAENKEAKSGKDYATFGMAVNRYLGKEKGADTTFYECIVFGKKQVEKVAEKIKSGDLVLVTGRPEAEAYLSKEGEAKSKLTVFVDDWQALK